MRMMPRPRGWTTALLLLAAAAAAETPPPAKAASPDLDLQLVIHHALFRGETPDPGAPSLLLDLHRRDGRWRRGWGTARSYNTGHHPVVVREARVTDTTLAMSLVVEVRRDAWTPGGWATLDIEASRDAAGGLEGAYAGTFRFRAVRGRVTGTLRPAATPLRPPAAPGEHPRLLFRKGDLDALKAKYTTPFGQAAMEKVAGTAAGQALLYQLTGDWAHADRAAALVRGHIATMENGSKMVRSRVWGWRLEQVALAYDMCHDGWSDQLKREVEDYTRYAARRLFYSKGLFHKEISWTMTAHYPGTILYGVALAGLAMVGEPGPAPEEPEPPFGGRDPERPVAPAADYEPGPGVPVSAFASDVMPDDWLFAGGFKPQADEEPLALLGGPAKARPTPDDALRVGDRVDTFRPIPRGDDKGYYRNDRITGGKRVIDITNAIGRVYHSTSYFYTVIRNDRPRWTRAAIGHGGSTMLLAGCRVREGDVVRLEPGLYPMLLVSRIGETNPWGRIMMRPRLIEITAEEAGTIAERARAVHALRRIHWAFDRDEHVRLGGADVRLVKMFETGRKQMLRAYRDGIGRGGFQGSPQFPMGLEGAHRYAAAHRTVFGTDVSRDDDITHYVPFKMFNLLHGPDGAGIGQDLHGEPDLWIRDVYHETRDLTGDFIAGLFPVIPEAWKPAALWFWNRHAGVAGPGDAAKILTCQKRPYEFAAYEAHPLYAFVNYPLDLNPVHPAEVMPLTWAADGFGYYGFRNRWKDERDFLTQIFVRTHPGGNRQNAGTLRIMGLGTRWSHGPGKAPEFRFGENVVQLPEDAVSPAACGRVLHHAAEPDGSGTVTMRLDDVYAGAKTGADGKPEPLYERAGGVRRASAFVDRGIRGIRAVAVDYSGASGAPCLLAIVDRIKGGGKKVWTWQLESKMEGVGKAKLNKKDKTVVWNGKTFPYKPYSVIGEGYRTLDGDPACRVDGRAFVISRGGATLQGTFVAPDPLRLAFAEKTLTQLTHKAGVRRASSRAVFASGGGAFFCVITIQEGPAPAVKVAGRGLDATVTVGRRTVRFDGEKIVLGP